MLKVSIRLLTPTAKIPKRMTEHAAGYDLFADVQETVTIQAGQVKLVSTGIAISLPAGYEAQIRPRSGLALKHRIGVLNSPGTIDADYRGEVQVILFNFGESDFAVEPQMRIAQMVISRHESADWLETDVLDESDRGSGGFGHSSL